MQLQEVFSKSRRAAAVMDVLEALTGLSLAFFLWLHMIFVASIYFGVETFDSVPHFLDTYYLSYVGIPPLIAIFYIHFILAARKIPTTFREQRIIWKQARHLRHWDTWTWAIQVVTGMAILILASIHFWFILSTWPIEAARSISRIAQLPYLAFYIILLLLGETHAGIGLYRLAVKWGWPSRKNAKLFFEFIIFAIVLTLGLGALYMFRQLAGGA